jgi:hypothetical protein
VDDTVDDSKDKKDDGTKPVKLNRKYSAELNDVLFVNLFIYILLFMLYF